MKEDFPTLKCINLVFLIFRVETILLFLKPNKWFRKPVNHLKKKKKKKRFSLDSDNVVKPL